LTDGWHGGVYIRNYGKDNGDNDDGGDDGWWRCETWMDISKQMEDPSLQL